MFSHFGTAEQVQESHIDFAGVLSKSLPTYAYLMMEATIDAAVKNGLRREFTVKMVAQALMGAAKLGLQCGKHPGQLKDDSCTPSGSTDAGIHVLELHTVRASFIKAIYIIAKRSTKLSF